MLDRGIRFVDSQTTSMTSLRAVLGRGDELTALVLLTRPELLGDLNSCNETGFTALHLAVQKNFPTVVRALVKGRASVTLRTKFDQMMPIHLACQCGHIYCLQILSKPSILNETARNKMTPLHYAAQSSILAAKHLLSKDVILHEAKNGQNLTP
jgi:ankyrin repeat protein